MPIFKESKITQTGHGTWEFYNSPPVDLQPRSVLLNATMVSFDHQNWPSGAGKGDVGGPWWMSKEFYESSNNTVEAQGLGRVYRGTVHYYSSPTAYNSGYLQQKPANFDSLVAAGGTAIARTIPTNPISGAAVFIGEARQGLPRFIGSGLLKTRARDLRSVGDEYLNVEFGWKPMMRDLQSFAKSAKASNKTLRQMYRDSGLNNVVRRRYHFPTEETGPSSALESPLYGGNVAPFRCDGGQLDVWMLGAGPSPTGYRTFANTTTKKWFSGAYSYVMPNPPSNNFMDKLDKWDAEANKLFGTRLTPEVVWNLAPWTWATDWFANTGDMMTNLSAFSNDGLVLRYGYIMQSHDTRSTSTWQGYVNHPSGGARYVQTQESFGSVSKTRLAALPYGFGTTFADLSARQVAIAGAIGISRSPRLSL